MTHRLVVTPGEPAGIGPDCCLLASQHHAPTELVMVGSKDMLAERAVQLGLPVTFHDFDPYRPHVPAPWSVTVYDVPLNKPCTAGQPNPDNVPYVLKTLDVAAGLCLSGHAAAMVTAPVNKGLIVKTGIPFSGHTEYLQGLTNTPLTQMLFVHQALRVSLATTHLPLSQVPASITAAHLEAHLTCLQAALKQYWHIANPHIAVLGLNPHAGESGTMGQEEERIMQPLIERLNATHFHLSGPLPADTAFTPEHRAQFDGILAMYHDQALAPLKALGFGQAVNITLGLPFLRTSVDHGTAFDKAGTGQIHYHSLCQAIEQAFVLTQDDYATQAA